MNRAEYRAVHATTTRADVAFALEVAETPEEVDAAAHLSLCLFDVAGTFNPFTEHGRDYIPLHNQVVHARHRVRGFHGDSAEKTAAFLNTLSENATAQRRREAVAARRADDERIERLGFNNTRN